jgi:hypothetical protein
MIVGGPLEAVTGGMMAWYRAKMFIEHAIFFSSDALHILVGVALWAAIAIVWRRPLSDWRPLTALLFLLALNEGVDLWVERWPDLAMQYGESAKDLLLTLAVPVFVMLLARWRTDLFSGSGRRAKRRRRAPGGRAR